LTNAGPREVVIGVLEICPTLPAQASSEKRWFAPIPGIASVF